MRVPKGYKMTEVGMIPEDWEVREIGEYFEFKNGLNKEKKYFGYGFPIVNYMDVFTKRGLTLSDIKGKVDVTKNELNAFEVKRGDVLFTRTSETVDEIGLSAVVLEEIPNLVFSGFLLRARQRTPLLSQNYLQYCFHHQAVRKEISGSSSYTTRALTNGRLLSQVHFFVPPTLAEQEAIATALGEMDALIAAQVTLIEKKRLVKQGAMQRLLSGEERLPGFEGEWVVKRLGEVGELASGGTPSTGISTYWGGSIPWMSSGELNNRRVHSVAGRITREGLDNSSAKLLPCCCVLVGLAGQGKTRGTVAMNFVELCTNQSIAAILPSDCIVDRFLYHHMDWRYQELRDLSSGDGGRGGLSLGLLKKLEMVIPESRSEQQQIAFFLDDIDSEIETCEDSLQKLRHLKEGMMQSLLTGAVRLV